MLLIPAHLPTLTLLKHSAFLGKDPAFFTITGTSVAVFLPSEQNRIPAPWGTTNSTEDMSLACLAQQHGCFPTYRKNKYLPLSFVPVGLEKRNICYKT